MYINIYCIINKHFLDVLRPGWLLLNFWHLREDRKTRPAPCRRSAWRVVAWEDRAAKGEIHGKIRWKMVNIIGQWENQVTSLENHGLKMSKMEESLENAWENEMGTIMGKYKI